MPICRCFDALNDLNDSSRIQTNHGAMHYVLTIQEIEEMQSTIDSLKNQISSLEQQAKDNLIHSVDSNKVHDESKNANEVEQEEFETEILQDGPEGDLQDRDDSPENNGHHKGTVIERQRSISPQHIQRVIVDRDPSSSEPIERAPSTPGSVLSVNSVDRMSNGLRSVPEPTPEMNQLNLQLYSLEDQFQGQQAAHHLEEEEFAIMFDGKFKECGDRIIDEMKNMMTTNHDMKRLGIRIDEQEKEKQMKLVMDEVIHSQHEALRGYLERQMTKNREMIQSMMMQKDGNVKMLIDRLGALQQRHNQLIGEYEAMRMKTQSEYNEYEHERLRWQQMNDSLQKELVVQSERRWDMERLQSKLTETIKMKEEEMKRQSDEIRQTVNMMIKDFESKEFMVKEQRRRMLEDDQLGNELRNIREALRHISNGKEEEWLSAENQRKEIKKLISTFIGQEEERKQQKESKQLEIKQLLEKVLRENELRRNQSDQITGKLKDIMDCLAAQNVELERMQRTEEEEQIEDIEVTEEQEGDEESRIREAQKEQRITEMSEKLDGIQVLIEREKMGGIVRMNAMKQQLEELQSLVTNCNNEYKNDYLNLVQILSDTKNTDLNERGLIGDKLKNIMGFLQDQQSLNMAHVARREQGMTDQHADQMDLVQNYNTKTKEIEDRLNVIQSLIESGLNQDVQSQADSNALEEQQNMRLMEMKQTVEGIQSMVRISNSEYKRDYENLVTILNQNGVAMKHGFTQNQQQIVAQQERQRIELESEAIKERDSAIQQRDLQIKERDAKIAALESEIMEWEQAKEIWDEKAMQYESTEGDLRADMRDLRERYLYLKRILIFVCIFGAMSVCYYLKRRGNHLKSGKVRR